MDDTFITIIIILAVCYILFTMYKKDNFISQPHLNNTVRHLPSNYIQPPNIYNTNRIGGNNIEESDALTLNDIDDIINDYENINNDYGNINNAPHGYNLYDEVKRNRISNIKREDINNIINNKYQIQNRNINKYRECDVNRKQDIDEIKDEYINNERRNNRNKYANFKDKVYRNGVVYTSVDKLAEIRSNPYDNNIGKIGDTISNVYDNLLSTEYDK
jgi:hypothetical protein